VAAQRDHTPITMNDIYNIMTTQERERERKFPVSNVDNEDT
jgi:hypothetical protein